MQTGSAGLIENQIKNWVRQNVCLVSPEYGRCKKVAVRHMSVEKKPTGDVHTINMTSDPAFDGTEIADKVIMEISDAAQRDANDMKSGVQTYGIYAYYTKDPNYVPRKLFRVAAEEDFEPDGGPSESPTDKGLLQQLMRHNEINSKNGLVGMGYILQTFQKEIEQQRAMNRQLLASQMETTVMLQDVMNDFHKRRQEEKKTDMEMSVYEGVFEHLKVVLPIIANKLAGKEIFPARMERELYVLAAFLENLSGEQQQVLRDMLTPQQVTLLAELLEMYEGRKQKLTGETTPDETQAATTPKNGEEVAPRRAPNRLLKLFEKRGNLVNKDSRLVITDDVTRKIEEKAAKIRDRTVRAIQELTKDDDKE